MKKNFICIVCPTGCRLTVSREPDGEITVSGNRCSRGVEHGRSELRDPRRTVTAVIPGNSILQCCVPVKTDAPVPVQLINHLLNEIYSCNVNLPIKCGEPIIANFRGTGINVVATRTINRFETSNLKESKPL